MRAALRAEPAGQRPRVPVHRPAGAVPRMQVIVQIAVQTAHSPLSAVLFSSNLLKGSRPVDGDRRVRLQRLEKEKTMANTRGH